MNKYMPSMKYDNTALEITIYDKQLRPFKIYKKPLSFIQKEKLSCMIKKKKSLKIITKKHAANRLRKQLEYK